MDTSTSKLAGSYDSLIDRGLMRIQELDPVGAESEFEAALQLEPSRYEAHFNLGSLAQIQGRHEVALEYFATSLHLHPDHADGWYSRGLSLSALARWDEASEAYDMCLAIEENYVKAYMAKGAIEMNRGAWADAEQYLNRFLELHEEEASDLTIQTQIWLRQIEESRKGEGEEEGESIQQLMDLANEALENGEIDKAIERFTEVLAIQPRYSFALANRAQMYVLLKDYRSALLDIHQAIELDPEAAVLHANLGHVYQSMGDREKALEAYNEALAMDAEQLEARGYKAILLMDAEPEASMKTFHEVLENTPDFADVWIAKAKLHLDRKEYAQSAQDCQTAAELSPDKAEIYELLDQLREHYDQKITTSPNDPHVYVERAKFFYQIGKDADALADWDRAIQLDNSNAILIHSRAMAYRDLENLPFALRDLDRAIELAPDQVAFYRNRAIVRAELFRPEEALEDLAHAITLSPEKPELFLIRGKIFRLMANYESALADLSEVLHLGRKDGEVYYERGMTYLALQQMEAAAADYIEAVKYDDSPEICYDCGVVLAWLGRFEEALPYLDMALEHVPDYHDALVERGNVHLALGSPKPALQDLTQALEIDPTPAEPWLLRAEAYLMLGYFDYVVMDTSRALLREARLARALDMRARAFVELGKIESAINDIAECLRVEPDYAEREHLEGLLAELKQ